MSQSYTCPVCGEMVFLFNPWEEEDSTHTRVCERCAEEETVYNRVLNRRRMMRMSDFRSDADQVHYCTWCGTEIDGDPCYMAQPLRSGRTVVETICSVCAAGAIGTQVYPEEVV